MTAVRRRALTAVDAVFAATLLAATLLRLLARSTRTGAVGRGLLVLDAAYSLDAVRARGIEHSLLSRDLEGFFSPVWHAHPLVGADPTEADAAFGLPAETALAEGHHVVEGHAALSRRPALPLLSFVRAQRAFLRRMDAILATGEISVVRVGDPFYLGLLGLALARPYGLPVVVRINGNYDQIYEAVGRLAYPRLFRARWVEHRIARFVLRRAALVAGANRDNLRYAIANGAPPERGTVFPYGALIDPAHRSDPAVRGSVLPTGPTPVAIAVTRLEPVKQVADLVEVLAQLRSEFPALCLVLVGEGAQATTLQSLAADLGVADGLILVGNQDQTWIAAALAEADIVLAASAGRVLVEAALSGTPVVAYDVDWHGELVHDGVTGRLVPFKDVEAMARAAADLLREPNSARLLGAAARTAAGNVMDPARLVQHERETYTALLVSQGQVTEPVQ